MADYTPGRFVMADTDNAGMRDVAGLVNQVSLMRISMENVLNKPVGLIVIAVEDDERRSAVGRIQAALDTKLDGDGSS